jgi:tRNA dimethylallyltransferase
MKSKTVIILLGPTGVGKTGLSILLARHLKTEIISADSMQIYRFMDIGTAKPSLKARKEVKHHLIDILPPDRSFSAGLFKKMAIQIIDSIHNKGLIPIIVGGTGLYIRTLTKGLFKGPEADWTLRDRLNEEEERFGKGYLYKRLQAIDPLSADRINPNDLRRVIRALEVSLRTRKTITESRRLTTRPQDYNFTKIGLQRERKELYEIIDKRADTMIQMGLLEETERLLAMNPARGPLQALGYKEMRLFINGSISIDEAVRLLKRHTKMFAKRQFTWFKKEPEVHWVDITGIMDENKIFTKVLNDVKILKELIYGETENL